MHLAFILHFEHLVKLKFKHYLKDSELCTANQIKITFEIRILTESLIKGH